MEVFASCRSGWPGLLYYNMDCFIWLYLVTRNFEWQQDNHDSQCCWIHKSSQKAKNGDPSGTLKYLWFIASERRERHGVCFPGQSVSHSMFCLCVFALGSVRDIEKQSLNISIMWRAHPANTEQSSNVIICSPFIMSLENQLLLFGECYS